MSPGTRLRVAIIGTGNIGTDLMFKVERSPGLELAGVAGIDPSSAGLRMARDRGHAVSETGLAGLLDLVPADRPGVRRDVGSDPRRARAGAAERGIRSVDLTPAALGPAIVPPVNLAAYPDAAEINLVTCGAQATVPIVAAVRSLPSSHTPRPSRPSRPARPGLAQGTTSTSSPRRPRAEPGAYRRRS